MMNIVWIAVAALAGALGALVLNFVIFRRSDRNNARPEEPRH